MATGDAAAAAGLPVVPGNRDLRQGYADINALADAVVKLIADRLAENNTLDPNAKNTFASNVEATRAGAKTSVQTFLAALDARNAANTVATGPDGGQTSIQSYLNLLNQRTAGLG